ncbi:MAG TPA: hypothetical protein VMF69_05745 [Gemmataceae bacterium]|nr:hypothetical protein [Gemmataceae bacterium]
MRHTNKWFVLVLLCGSLAAACARDNPRAQKSPPPPEADVPLGPNSLGLTFTPMPDWFHFRTAAEVQTWIDEDDVKAMMEHAWELWGGLTSPTTQTVKDEKVTYPIFETWVDEFKVFPPPKSLARAPKESIHLFDLPRQLHLGQSRRPKLAAAKEDGSPADSLGLVTVKYTKEIFEHVQKNQYYKTEVMNTLNQSWDNSAPPTPLAGRKVKNFPNTSIMLKPTYQVISGTSATLLPYWAGPANSSNPAVPGVKTWTKKMLLIPPGVTATPIRDVPIVKIERFYNFKLNQIQVDYLNSLGQGTFKVGDYAILVAMHVSSREIDNWTWQTFWWSLEKPKIPEAVRHRVVSPFDNYASAVGYAFTTGPNSPTGLNVLCFNPYLEADFDNDTFALTEQVGIESNCISCHRAATWPPPSFPSKPKAQYFTGNGLLRSSHPYFTGTTKVDFLWGFALDVLPPPVPPVQHP